MSDSKFTNHEKQTADTDKQDCSPLDQFLGSLMISLFAALAGALLFVVDHPNPETISIQEGLKQTGYAFVQYFVGLMIFCLLYFYVLNKMKGITSESVRLYAQRLWKDLLVRAEARRLGMSYQELLALLEPSEGNNGKPKSDRKDR